MKKLICNLMLLMPLLAFGRPALVDVKIYPADVNLNTKQDRQSVVLQATYDDGTTQDVTDKASYTIADRKIVKLDKTFVVLPLADGKTELKVRYGGKTLVVPVKVEKAAAERPISFVQDVMPVFMKSGCNTGSCHGAARGKDGFRLSLFGFDPEGDYFRLTREMIGRRVNLAIPEDSLVLTKATGQAQHTGGERFKPDSARYATLKQWLDAGAPKDADNVARVVGVEIAPKQSVLEGPGASQRLTVRAKYSDGTDRDVTPLAVFITNNDVAAKVSDQGVVTAGKRGEAFIMARFDNFTVGSQAISIPKDPKFVFPKIAVNNYVDTLVNAKLKKNRVLPSELCDDATFVRRVSLDVAGLLPTAEETHKFVGDKDPKKREKKIDELLERKEFVKMWVMKWAELLQIATSAQANKFQYKSVLQYYTWLEDQFAKDVPLDKLVQQIIASKGGTFQNPAANFYKIETETLKISENAAQVFMGMRIQCSQCHNHPFDRWRMDDYYSFAAFFAQVGRKAGEDPRETVVFNSNGGGVQHPVTKRDMKPKFLGGDVPDIKPGEDRREVLAKWLASPQNPAFARNIANIIWAHFMGKGIVDPVDDVRISNPPSNPELLETLAEKLTGYNYDFKKLVRDICNSRTYQLSAQSNKSNAGDTRNFAKAYVRRIRAEVLLDCINQVTDTKEKFRGLPLGSRAVEIADGKTSTYFLTTFGRASRDTVCSCEVKTEPNLSQALHLLNGETVNEKVVNGGIVKNLLQEGRKPKEVIEALYVRCFSRPPTSDEMTKLEGFLKGDRPAADVLNDLFWSMLNAKEFIFNH